MATIKGKLKQRTADGSNILHPETEADIVSYSNTVGGTSVTTVKGALDQIITAGVGVTGVKGNAESSYRSGNVNLEPDDIGAVPTSRKVNGQALSSDITLSASNVGAIASSSRGAANGVASLDSNTKIPMAQLPDVILGQLVFGGTVTGAGEAALSANGAAKLGGNAGDAATLVNQASNNVSPLKYGWTATNGIYFIVSSDGNFASLGLKVGDWLLSTGAAWKKIDNTDAVTSVNGNIGAVTLYGADIAMSSSDATKVKAAIEAKYTKPNTGIPASDLQDTYATASALSTTDAKIKVTNATVSNTGSGNAVTSVSISSGQIVATKGTTFLTSHQSLANYVTLNTPQDIYAKKTFSEIEVGEDVITNIDNTGIAITGDASVAIGASGVSTSGVVESKDSSANFAQLFSGDSTYQEGLSIYHTSGSPSNQVTRTKYLHGKITRKINNGGEQEYYLPSSSGTLLVAGNVTAGTYSAVTVSTTGLVTAGGQVFEVVNNGATPTVATGGLYFEKNA